MDDPGRAQRIEVLGDDRLPGLVRIRSYLLSLVREIELLRVAGAPQEKERMGAVGIGRQRFGVELVRPLRRPQRLGRRPRKQSVPGKVGERPGRLLPRLAVARGLQLLRRGRHRALRRQRLGIVARGEQLAGLLLERADLLGGLRQGGRGGLEQERHDQSCKPRYPHVRSPLCNRALSRDPDPAQCERGRPRPASVLRVQDPKPRSRAMIPRRTLDCLLQLGEIRLRGPYRGQPPLWVATSGLPDAHGVLTGASRVEI